MRVVAIASVLVLLCFGPAMAANPIAFEPGTGVPNGGQGGSERSIVWSEPPDLNGMIASSEIINVFGIVSEVANDFVPSDTPIHHAAWWGGYFNNSTPCQGTTTPGFNLRFYGDAGCAPGTVIADLSVTQFSEESVGCQSSQYPLYKWGADVSVALTAGTRYWFGAQMKNHTYPPQAGRLASMAVVGCESMFKSTFYGYPDWTLAEDVFGVAYDASQEFDGGPLPEACCFADGHCEYILSAQCTAEGGTPQGQGTVCDPNSCPQPLGACCFPDGHCENLTQEECTLAGGSQFEANTDCAHFNCPQPPTGACCFGEQCVVETENDCVANGGAYQGDGTGCEPNPCHITPTRPSSWGKIKGLYR